MYEGYHGNWVITRTVFDALTFESSTLLHPTSAPAASSQPLNAWQAPMKKVWYRVGPAADVLRVVCRDVFLSNYP
eukprot:2242120-Pleurochrysis_carterae.AAC.1